MPALLLTGAIIMIAGLVLFVVWFEYLWALIKALAPLAIIGVGAIVTYFGWEEKKDRSGAFLDFSSPTEASRYQAEALAYQEKLDGIQEASLAKDKDKYPDAVLEKDDFKEASDEPKSEPSKDQDSDAYLAQPLAPGSEPPKEENHSEELISLEIEDGENKT
ncbi:MAG: hypothetical protein LBF22_12065 [Deltaproteobacteria bacterium]|jgi:FtsZ-interacting cell division protein ZipA|nr:hypothetical protein [Deltaproteobacteria bacterium]